MNNIKIVAASEEHIDDLVEVENLCFTIPWSRQSLIDEIVHNDKRCIIAPCTMERL